MHGAGGVFDAGLVHGDGDHNFRGGDHADVDVLCPLDTRPHDLGKKRWSCENVIIEIGGDDCFHRSPSSPHSKSNIPPPERVKP
jgi:hypothetical protein